MPSETQVVPSPKTRPVTRRTSIRQSLNLASVSKAFADVINKSDKDTKDANKPSKRTKESRRHSVQPATKPSHPRTSMGDVRSPSQATNRTATPESKGSARRRGAAGSRVPSDEQPPRPESANNTPKAQPQVGVVTRAASLRAKNANLAASSLPKYRPKLAVTEQPKPPSPVTVRAGTRRRLSSSDDSEKEEKRKPAAASSGTASAPGEKVGRPISPLPQRAALKSLNTATPTPLAATPKSLTPTPGRSSPPRPAKTHKNSSSTSAVPRPSTSSSTASAGPRPPSASSSSSIPSQTPQTPVARSLRRSSKDVNKHSSNSVPPESPSPPTRHVRARSEAVVGNMSHISERADEDDDEADQVELLLAPVATPSAPTPAMPRIVKSRSRRPPAPPPKTPSRGSLPTRENISYLSPAPPGSNEGEFGELAHLRPPQISKATSSARNLGRGSILSWEQLASEASKTLGHDELDKMLHDIPAPFQSGAASPALTATLEIPASPCLSALDSPTGYGSISQVLLPDVTPSPAVHASQRYNPPSSESIESPVTNLLRLQLAQMENIAKERLMQMQAMEQEIHSLKEIHSRQMQESSRHIAYLEAQGRKSEDTKAYASSLEERLRQAEAVREQAVREASRRSEENVRRSLDGERRKERVYVRMSYAAKVAKSEWVSVKDLAEVELDLVRGDRAVLSVLLAELDQLARSLC